MRGTAPSGLRDRVLDFQFLAFEQLYGCIVWYRPDHFLMEQPVDTGMFVLKGADMRSFHAFSP